MSTFDPEVKKEAESISKDISISIEHAKSYPGQDGRLGFDFTTFFDSLTKVSKRIEYDSSSLFIISKPPVKSSEVLEILEKLKSSISSLSLLLFTIPESMGNNWIKLTKEKMTAVLMASLDMLKTYTTDNSESEGQAGSRNLLPEELTNYVTRTSRDLLNIPKNNKEAVMYIWKKDIMELVQDACDELKDTIESAENADDDQESDSVSIDDFDMELSRDKIPVAKKIRALLLLIACFCKKILLRSICSDDRLSQEKIYWLDELLEMTARLPAKIDTLISTLIECELVEGSDSTEISKLIQDLAKCSISIINLAINMTDNEHTEWFERCKDALFKHQLSCTEEVANR
ncbi:hypothetical protein H4219_000817 [Mycoemilia scoparia]|uniref:Cyclin-D1-binding protein 1-like N-terminal domain-containing protein n=1 Tax=Mycoemilia scoparia TaxID=417184 RepID=A0A9W8A8A6_9FUNG|nr:hypothetical protein H4219_000817 [Mycoemilia scoparia]